MDYQNQQNGYNQNMNPYAQGNYGQNTNPYAQNGAYQQNTNPYAQNGAYQQNANPYAQNGYGQNYYNPYGQPGYQQPMNYYQMRKMDTDRNFWKLVLLSVVTCGIYPIIFYTNLGEDIDFIARARDGKKTMHYCLMYFLLAPITCGIMSFVWNHQISERIGDEARARGIKTNFSATTYWLWAFLGSFIVVGPFVYMYKLCKTMNMVCGNYNYFGTDYASIYQYQPVVADDDDYQPGLGLALGIVSCIYSFNSLIGLSTGISGLVFAIKGYKKYKSAMSIWGIVLSALGLVLTAFWIVVNIVSTGAFLYGVSEGYNDYYYY